MIPARAALPLLALLAASCRGPSLYGDLDGLRAEIQELERTIPPEAPLWIDQGPDAFPPYLADYSSRIPDFIYDHIARKLERMTAEDVRALAQPKTPVEGYFDRAAELRGKVFPISGIVVALSAHRGGSEGLPPWMYSGVVLVGEQPVLFHAVEKPDVLYLGRDRVEFQGLFVKIIRYRSTTGEEVDAPFFMVKSVQKYY